MAGINDKSIVIKRKSVSNYRYGRNRSRSLGGIIFSDITDMINKSLPPEERLKALIEYSVEKALRIVLKEVGESINSLKFEENLAKCLIDINNSIEKEELYNLAITGDESYAAQKSIEENLALYNKAVSKLDEENQQWDEIISKEQALLEASKSMPKVTFEDDFDCSKFKSKDYSKILENCSSSGKYEDKVEDLNNFSKTLAQFSTVTNKFAACLNAEAKQCFSKTTLSPRTLMIQMHQKK